MCANNMSAGGQSYLLEFSYKKLETLQNFQHIPLPTIWRLFGYLTMIVEFLTKVKLTNRVKI